MPDCGCGCAAGGLTSLLGSCRGPVRGPGEGEVLALLPNYATLCGAATPGQAYLSDPVEVTAYGSVAAEAYFAGRTGSASLQVVIEQSNDLVAWTLACAMAPAVGTVVQSAASDFARYLRAKVIVTGADTVATLWVKAVCRRA
jgi:hypothetical protein